MLISEKLNESHDLESFDSGNEYLNIWLKTQARRAQAAGMAQVYVWRDSASPAVLAYHAVTPTNVAPTGLSRTVRGGYTGPIPGYLITQLALDVSMHGDGFGAELVLDALECVAGSANLGGGRLVVVDAIDANAYGFYQHCGFTPITDTQRFYMRVDRIAETVAASKYGPVEARTAAAVLGFSWAFTDPPKSKIILQLEPLAATRPRAVKVPSDVIEDMFGRAGFRRVADVNEPLPTANNRVTCRIDSPTHLTVVLRYAAVEAADIEVPHETADLTAAIRSDGYARVYATTDSIGPDQRVSAEMLHNDVANGGVFAALVIVS